MNQKNINKARKSIKYGKFKSSEPLLIVLMGLPGTGKSYLSDYLNKKYSFTILSGENITYSIFGTEKCSGSQFKEAYEILHYLAVELLKKKNNIVIDGTNLKYEFRRQIYKTANNLSKKVLIYLYTSDATALKRANSRGEDYNDSKMILSKCSPETFQEFTRQLESPNKHEAHFKIKSDDKLFENIDSIIKNILKE
ncbi:MAG: ATP-binding protein [Candidatus Berkelbacteria bacterium]|nr:ATP-binding protein [Candidatus Berkelbacteria bacterium]